MTKPKFRFEKPIVKSKTEPASKNVLWYFSQQKKGLTINTIKEYVKAQGWIDLFDTAPIELGEAIFTENGIYESNENGWNKVIVDVPPIELSSTTFTENGQYTNPDGGWNEVNVDIPLKDTRAEYFMFYTSSDGHIVSPPFGGILSNIYANQVGIITFSAPLTNISKMAFNGQTTLTSITIPNSVTSIGYEAFYECTSLNVIYVEATTPPTLEQYAFTNTPFPICYIPQGTKAAYESSDWVQYVKWFVEEGSEEYIDPTWQITYTSTDGNIVTPYSVNFGANIVSNEYIDGQGVITFDGPVKKIGSSAFRSCSTLTSITLPNSATSIDMWAFSDCPFLSSVIVGNRVAEIGMLAFEYSTSLSSITLRSTTPPALFAVDSLSSSITAIYVPSTTVSSYKNATNWSRYSSIIQPIQ